MMKNFLTILAVVLSFATSFSQTSERIGTFSLSTFTGTDPNFTVTGSYVSPMGFNASTGAQVGDWIVCRYVNGSTHRRQIYRITSIPSAGVANITMTVTRIHGISTAYFPPGTSGLVSPVISGSDTLIYDVPNVSQELESYITDWNLNKLVLGGGGGGATDLAYTASPTNGVVTNTGGTDATLPLGDATNAGLLKPADYTKLNYITVAQAVDLGALAAASHAAVTLNEQGNGVDLALSGQQLSASIDVSELPTATVATGDLVLIGDVSASGISRQVTAQSIADLKVEVDGDVANEGILTVGAGTSTTSTINSNTSGSTPVTLTAGTGMAISEVGNVITLSATGGGAVGDSTVIASVDNTIEVNESPANNFDLSLPAPRVNGVASAGYLTLETLSGLSRLNLKNVVDTTYSVTITGGNAGAYMSVTATGPGVTAAYASGVYTITKPNALVKILSVNILMVTADVQAASDGSVTDWVRVVLPAVGVTGIANARFPNVQKISHPASGVLSVTNAASIDADNNPAMSWVGAASGLVTFRINGVAPSAQGYGLVFNF